MTPSLARSALLFAALIAATTACAEPWDDLQFDLPSGTKESVWRDALAQRLGGITEQRVSNGRIDVTTSNEVFELDRQSKWKEGMGQVLAYAGDTGKKPVLALISYSQGPAKLHNRSRYLFEKAQKECARHGVRLLILFPNRSEEFPHTAHQPTSRHMTPTLRPDRS